MDYPIASCEAYSNFLLPFGEIIVFLSGIQ
jgi:hypothetical protein